MGCLQQGLSDKFCPKTVEGIVARVRIFFSGVSFFKSVLAVLALRFTGWLILTAGTGHGPFGGRLPDLSTSDE